MRGWSISVYPKPCEWNTWPLMAAARSEARKETSGATLSGSLGVPFASSLGHLPVSSNIFREPGLESIIRVVPVGSTTFAVTPYFPMAFAVE